MPYFTPGNTKHYGVFITLATPADRTAGGSAIAWVMGVHDTLRLDLDVTVVDDGGAGDSPALTVTIEHGPDGSTWSELGSFDAVTAAGKVHKVFSGCDNYVRASWSVTGASPTFGFGVTGEAA